MQKAVLKQKALIFTQEGFDNLRKEQAALLVKRKDVIETLKKAREMGDLSENGLYKAAKFELGDTDRKLRKIKYMLSQGIIADKKVSDNVGIGSLVLIEADDKQYAYTVVGDYEADPLNKKVSQYSPIGKALMGKKAGDRISFTTPSGNREYTLIKISN